MVRADALRQCEMSTTRIFRFREFLDRWEVSPAPVPELTEIFEFGN
jgi:hypothetical protein